MNPEKTTTTCDCGATLTIGQGTVNFQGQCPKTRHDSPSGLDCILRTQSTEEYPA